MRLILVASLGLTAALFAAAFASTAAYWTHGANWSNSLAIIPPGASLFLFALLLAVSALTIMASLIMVSRRGPLLASALLSTEPIVVTLPFLVLLANSNVVFTHPWSGEIMHGAAELAARLAATGLAFTGLSVVLTFGAYVGRLGR